MQELQQQQGGGLARIEPVQDPEVNRALFTMYNNLIEPLAQIERTHSEIMETETMVGRMAQAIRFSFSDALKHAVKLSLKLAVVLFIVLLVIAQFNETLENMKTTTVLKIIAVVALAVSLIWAFCAEAVSSASRERNRKAIHDRAVDELAKLEDSLKWQVSQIREVIMFVPPKYRFSEALRYFVESYLNSRIDNLKEAVNAFDTYYFRSQTIQMQREMLEKQQENNELMQAIAYNQLCMMGQLGSIQRDIWLSGGIFS